MMRTASQAFNEKFSRFSNRISRNLIEEEPEPLEMLEKKRKIRFMGRFKKIKLWIPLDSRQKYSSVFSFLLISQTNFRRDELTLDTVETKTFSHRVKAVCLRVPFRSSFTPIYGHPDMPGTFLDYV